MTDEWVFIFTHADMHAYIYPHICKVHIQKISIFSLFWRPSIANDNVFFMKWGRTHVLKKFIVRRGCTVPSPLISPSTKKSDGTEKLSTTSLMDDCSVLPRTQFVGTRLCVDTTPVLSVGDSPPSMVAAEVRPDLDIKPPLGAPLLIFPPGYLLKSCPQGDTSTRQSVF